MKERYAHIGLLAIAAVIVLYLLMRRSAVAASNGSAVADGQIIPAPSYPNSTPLKLGDIKIGPSPTNITYNSNPLFPNVALGDGSPGSCPCDFDACAASQDLTYINKIPPSVLDTAAASFAGYQQKLTSQFAEAPAEAVNF